MPDAPLCWRKWPSKAWQTSRPSRDLHVAAHQQITSEWWHDHRHRFELFVSPRVLAEARFGDAVAARRLTELEGIPLLAFTPEARHLATRLLGSGPIPERSAQDAAHVAIATVHGMDYLLTWNCRHIVNAEIMKALSAVATGEGYVFPILCTHGAINGRVRSCSIR